MAVNVVRLDDIGRADVALAGGKGAHLGELTRIDGVSVPAGFCVTTDAYRRIVAEAPSIGGLLDRLSHLEPDDADGIRVLSAELRHLVEGAGVPDDVAVAVVDAVAGLGEDGAYAVRSSATAEDLPSASFAGQQDTYLNVVGTAAVLRNVSRCWGSLFTERAVAYRLRNGFDHAGVRMAVVVQRMVFPDAAGVLFTADPVTSNRKVVSVEACLGLGEALVSGRVDGDVYTVRDGEIAAARIATKRHALRASPEGGTLLQPVDVQRRRQPVLTDAQVVLLARLARRIEAHFDCPQDIEWCLAGDRFHIVQSRPITTLFPVPDIGDGANHVFLSVGHAQMMTDAMKPLGLSVWQLTALRPMYKAGGRLFVDVARDLAAPASRAARLELFGRSDPLVRDALETILERGDFIPEIPEAPAAEAPARSAPVPIETDAAAVTALIERFDASLAVLESNIRGKSGTELLDFILADIQELKRLLVDPQSSGMIMAAMQAAWWLNDNLQAWLGETNAADTLTRSVPHNITSEMGLALLDVADVIRPHPELVAFLEHVQDGDAFLYDMDALPGGREARDAIQLYLERYGVRCAGEIDITRPRWRERPSTLVPIILGHIRNFEPGAGERRFEQGLQEARQKEQELLDRLRALPDGDRKAEETKRMIDRVRTCAGYREYPKYALVSRYFVYKEALLDEAERLVRAGVLTEKEDLFHLTFQELQDVVRAQQLDEELIRRRKDEFRTYQALTPPRVLTSDGEVVAGAYRRDDLPPGALAGLPVSAGAVEGRARVIRDMADADLEPGDILVTAYTDPSWTPLFVAIAGLVTEVGGLMTHGAVIAREYGLPAVVGVQNATKLIREGQRIRVHGTAGYVEILGASKVTVDPLPG